MNEAKSKGSDRPRDELLNGVQERAKELSCLYRVDDILNRQDAPIDEVFPELVDALPAGFRYSEICQARIVVEGRVFAPPGYQETAWNRAVPIVVEGEPVGEVQVGYRQPGPPADEGLFLKEERRLINAVAERIGYFLSQQRLRSAKKAWDAPLRPVSKEIPKSCSVILDFLRRTDPRLLQNITRKMINQLCWEGVSEAAGLLADFTLESTPSAEPTLDDNRPREKKVITDASRLVERTFDIAARHMAEETLISQIQTWIRQDKSRFLLEAVAHLDNSFEGIASALQRFKSISVEESELPLAVQTELRVSLVRRFLSDQISYINTAKKYVGIGDFHGLLDHTVAAPQSHGKLGGKSAGLFLAAHIIKRSDESGDLLRRVRVPKTWYVTSDTMIDFITYNNLEDIHGRKYMDRGQIRQDYLHVVQVFKNSRFSPEVTQALSVVLDDLSDRPIIVRSSSLLEDRLGASFTGKYKSLFLANRGTKSERLEALVDAIAEVYASLFNPDAIEYRTERGLIDLHEEMAILIQEVVGAQVGKYFFPALSGVAFSSNEFRWSPRIRREDGLLRLVPGLGTRAVDRLSDDYPVLLSPAQPNLRVNVTPDEVIRYSPKKIDVINMETRSFETVPILDLLRDCGDEYPLIRRIVSVVEHEQIRRPSVLGPDYEKDDLVVTFEGLISDTPFVDQISGLLNLLERSLGYAVDIEFAFDGSELFLLQCRPQSYGTDRAPAVIPRNLDGEEVLFTANRYVTNGRISNLSHIIYVDPELYSEMSELEDLRAVGRAVGALNKLLPKRRFMLLGPGRWGSRGDIKLGVSVSYSDINNTALLVEMARKKGNYLPELSFGTHFFQDLVEADIRYLPLYPDEEGVVFNEPFFKRARNLLPQLVPRYSELQDAIRVIDVPAETGGRLCHVLMNGDLGEAVGLLGPPGEDKDALSPHLISTRLCTEDHWRWRMTMAERLASQLDPHRFGVKGLYVLGGGQNAVGAGSRLDLLVHFQGNEGQRRELFTWLEGWSRSLAEVNYLRTGCRSDGLLDVHLVTDEDIEKQTSLAARLDAAADAAIPLPLTFVPRPHQGPS